MIRYNYNQQVEPPAPFVHVTLGTPEGLKQLSDLPGLLDTGADKTVIPWHAVQNLGLIQTREVAAAGVDGGVTSLPAFLVQAAIRHVNPVVVEALASRHEPYVLLGRDILNRFRILLDGPHLILEIA